MDGSPTPAHILGRLADERRLRVLGSVALGDRALATIAERAGLTDDETARALAQLLGAGVVTQTEDGLEVDPGAFATAARTASAPRSAPDLGAATPEQALVLRNFVDSDGRIRALPAREEKRRVVLEWIAGRFEREREYPERQVNDVLVQVHDDYASLRRFLVDGGFLARERGIYQRV
jgi:hypothetical protein